MTFSTGIFAAAFVAAAITIVAWCRFHSRRDKLTVIDLSVDDDGIVSCGEPEYYTMDRSRMVR